MKEINREKFEAWLESLPDDRVFNYSSCTDCVVSSFVKEVSNFKNVSSSDVFVRLDAYSPTTEVVIRFEPWLIDLLGEARLFYGTCNTKFTALTLKKAYAKLFPPTNDSFDLEESHLVGTETSSQV